MLVLGFSDGRKLSALLVTADVANALFALIEIDPDDYVQKSELSSLLPDNAENRQFKRRLELLEAKVDLIHDGVDGKDGADGKDGKSIIGAQGEIGRAGKNAYIYSAYLDDNQELILATSDGVFSAGVVELSVDDNSVELDVYEKAKLKLIMAVGTGWTLPRIDRAVRMAEAEGYADYDLIIDFAKSELE